MNNMISRTLKDQSLTLELDRPHSSANVIDFDFFDALNQELDFLECHPEIETLYISSKKKGIFIAGADLNQFKKGMSIEEIQHLIRLGHDTFSRLRKLPQVSIARIHGICVGGGLELALACDYRIASDDKSTKIGLPEVTLGILPGWGGTTRLPRMIGLRKALFMILSGKQFNSSSALRIGVIDGIVKKEKLLTASISYSQKGKKVFPLFPFENHPISTMIFEYQARKNILKKTQGHYPAPLRALQVAVKGLRGSMESSYKLEEKAFLDLISDPISMNLVNLFFLTERSKRVRIEDIETPPVKVKKVAIIGAGIMGSGIAQWISSKKFNTTLKDIHPEAVGKGMAQIQKILQSGILRKTFTAVEARDTLDRITPVSSEIPMFHQDLVIEAVVEKLDLKRQVIKDLESRTRPDTVLASNTSALSINKIAEKMEHPERMVGIHFFNPVHRMKLVEVIQGEKTSNQTLTTTLEFVKKIGKLPVLVKDSPGFLVNRILMPYLFESVRLFDQGYSIEQIDSSLLAFGMPMGPLRLIDEVGVDVAQHVASDLLKRLENPFPETQLLQKMLEGNYLGRKSGSGFYNYPRKINPNLKILDYKSYPIASEYRDSDLTKMMVYLMVNEGARCLEESVVKGPEEVDFGMVMGTGWAPFRGGPMRYADTVGIEKIVQEMDSYCSEKTPHFKPCNLLLEMASTGKQFFPQTASVVEHTPNDGNHGHQNAA